MALILSIETATHICSVALHKEGILLGLQELHLEKSHSGSLSLMIEQLLVHCDLEMDELDAIAIASGPGSYTGLRIGLSTAKGLCYALDKPLIAFSSLDHMVFAVKPYYAEQTLLVPMIDARRMEVYYKISEASLKELSPIANLIVEADSFSNWIEQDKNIVLFGNGAEKCQELYEDIRNISILTNVYPSAKHMGELAFSKFEKQQFEDLAYFEPNYVKEFYSPKPKKKSII